MLGLFFFALLLSVLGLLSVQWHVPIGYYGCFCLLALFALGFQNRTQSPFILTFDEQGGFYLVAPHPQPVQITHLWLSAWAVCIQVQGQSTERQHLVFWRGSQSITAWRHLYIHLLRYQLQYSGSAEKATL